MTIAVGRMIKWKLRQVMSDRRVSNKSLAEQMEMHPTSISNLKNRDDMPRVDGPMLNSLCKALECSPFDLIEYTLDEVAKT